MKSRAKRSASDGGGERESDEGSERAREQGREGEREDEGDGLGYGVINCHYARISHRPMEIQKI